jgi:hypothetical protein
VDGDAECGQRCGWGGWRDRGGPRCEERVDGRAGVATGGGEGRAQWLELRSILPMLREDPYSKIRVQNDSYSSYIQGGPIEDRCKGNP